jgi:type IV pilus assembly protein PilM
VTPIFSRTKSAIKPAGRPPAAVELSAEGVLAAAVSAAGQPPVYGFAPLSAGVITPSLSETNLHDSSTVASAIRSALDQVSPRSRAVTLIVPDQLVRVFVLDFDSLPGKSAEAIAILRFRLRKMVSFDVEHAAVSYQILEQTELQCRVLTAVMPGPVLAEYESAVRAAGFEPGVVLPSSLAVLEGLGDSTEAVLAANLCRSTLTTTISIGRDLLLYRTLDLPQDPVQRFTEIQRGIAVAAAYYEDRLQARPLQLHYGGSEPSSEFAWEVANPGLAVVELSQWAKNGSQASTGSRSTAAVAGALAGVQ